MRTGVLLALVMVLSGCASSSTTDGPVDALVDDGDSGNETDTRTLYTSQTAGGLFLQFHFEAGADCTLAIANGFRGTSSGPHTVSVGYDGASYSGWGSSSGSMPARVHVAQFDTNDILDGEGSGARRTRYSFEAGDEAWITTAVRDVHPVEHEWTGGAAVRITTDCADHNISSLRGGRSVLLVNEDTMHGTAAAKASAALVDVGAAVQVSAGRTFSGPVIVLGDAFSETLVRGRLDHPSGSQDVTWLPRTYAPIFVFEGAGGDYRFTVDKVDTGPIFTYMWLLMADAVPLESLQDLDALPS